MTRTRADMCEHPQAVRDALGSDPKTLKGLFWGVRKNPSGWSTPAAGCDERLVALGPGA